MISELQIRMISNRNSFHGSTFRQAEIAASIVTEDMMSINRSSSLVCNLGQSESDDFGSILESSGNLHDLLRSKSQDCSDKLQLHRKDESALAVFFRNALQSLKADPRQIEIEDAELKTLVEQVRRTYARLADAILWSILVCIFAEIALTPVLGWFTALVLAAGLVSAFWMLWDRIRRI